MCNKSWGVFFCFRCVRVATDTLSPPNGCLSKGSQRWLSSVSLATHFFFKFMFSPYPQNLWRCLTLWCFLTTTPSDLNRFTTSRWSISKSSVYVSFPLANLDLGPYGPVDCGNKKQSLFTVLPWRMSFTHLYVVLNLSLRKLALNSFWPEKAKFQIVSAIKRGWCRNSRILILGCWFYP